jgi:hypothetical protein
VNSGLIPSCHSPDNFQILPAWEAVHELAPNPYLVRFSPEVVPYLSRSMRHSLLCAALDHRIYQIANNSDSSKWVTNLRPKQLYHRGIAIRTLSDAIANEEERIKDSTLTALFLFFYIDVSNVASPYTLAPTPPPPPPPLSPHPASSFRYFCLSLK